MRIKAASLDGFLCVWDAPAGRCTAPAGLFDVEFWMLDVEFVLTSAGDCVKYL